MLKRSLLFTLLLGFVPGVEASGDPANVSSLLDRSPFGSLAVNQAGTPPANAPEFRGLMEDGGKIWFSLYDPSSKRSEWVEAGSSGTDYAIGDYQPNNATLRVVYRGMPFTLTLKEARIQAYSGGTVAGADVPPPVGRPAEIQPGANPSEQQRLAALAEEIRRRRALRQNAAANNANGVQPVAVDPAAKSP